MSLPRLLETLIVVASGPGSRGFRRLEKPCNVAKFLRRRVLGKRFHKNFTIGHALDAVIEQRQYAAVSFCANQAPESLLQGKHCLRHLILGERVATLLIERPHACRDDRITWDRKRQPVHNHPPELLSWSLHSLPETRPRKHPRL